MLSNIPDIKRCSICKKEKSLSEFYPLKSGKYGVDSKCKICDIEEGRKFSRTKKGLIFEIYRNIKKRIKNHQDNILHFSRDEFFNWLNNKQQFFDLHKTWVNNNYIVDLKPACYKIDSDMSYKLDNMSIATSKQVKEKIAKDRKSGANHAFNANISKAVIQYTKDGKFIKEFHSMHYAESQTGVPNGAISDVCTGKGKTAGGYKWEYSTNTLSKTKFGEKIEIKHLNDFLFEDIEEILGNEISIDTEKEEMVKCRIGQGKFREQLIEYWKGCSVTNFKKTELLIASHIKAWRSSNNKERLDQFNGLLLIPNLDKLFDKGYISFDNNGKIIISNDLKNYELLGVNPNMKINIKEEHKKYLEFHRSDVFEAYNKA